MKSLTERISEVAEDLQAAIDASDSRSQRLAALEEQMEELLEFCGYDRTAGGTKT